MKAPLRATAALFVAVALAAAPAAEGQETGDPTFGFTGSVAHRSAGAWVGAGALDPGDFSYGSTTSLSATLRALGDGARAEASFEASVSTGIIAAVAWAAAGSSDTIVSPDPASEGPPSTLFALRARTLFVKLDLGPATVQAGRQVVNFGSGLAFSPADVFASIDLSGLQIARRGVDAIRVAVPLGDLSSLDLVAAPTASPADGIYALRLRGFALGVDAAATASRDGDAERWSFAADFKTDLVAGLYGEAVVDLAPDADPVFRGMAGADWSIGDFLFAGEYHCNGAAISGGGPLAPEDAFPGPHNLYLATSWSLTDFVSLSASCIADLRYGLGSATLLCSVDAAQNATVNAYIRASNGSPAMRKAALSGDAGVMIEVKF
ncbi:MAG: hypothetical protein NT080_10280 [Spirochaetes bacterium]|nr:hypothetical protein [Spirochaetota bacterium]